MGPAAKRRKLNTSAVEEVTFDDTARYDYLTGFHKRKVQRAKAAREAASRTARQERIDDRKKLREERKADLERHVKEINAMLPTQSLAPVSDDDDEGEKAVSGEDWNGISDPVLEPVDHEAEYIDEDKYTTVTVEEVDISRDGMSRLKGNNEDNAGEVETAQVSEEKRKEPPSKRDKDRDKRPKKKKKKAFRYESPAERKLGRAKVRAKNSKQAKARRGD